LETCDDLRIGLQEEVLVALTGPSRQLVRAAKKFVGDILDAEDSPVVVGCIYPFLV
jgi:hypothetical protein